MLMFARPIKRYDQTWLVWLRATSAEPRKWNLAINLIAEAKGDLRLRDKKLDNLLQCQLLRNDNCDMTRLFKATRVI